MQPFLLTLLPPYPVLFPGLHRAALRVGYPEDRNTPTALWFCGHPLKWKQTIPLSPWTFFKTPKAPLHGGSTGTSKWILVHICHLNAGYSRILQTLWALHSSPVKWKGLGWLIPATPSSNPLGSAQPSLGSYLCMTLTFLVLIFNPSTWLMFCWGNTPYLPK